MILPELRQVATIPELCYIGANINSSAQTEGGEEKMDFYCVKCRAKKTVDDDECEKGVAKNGRPYVKAICPDCGTKMFKFVKAE